MAKDKDGNEVPDDEVKDSGLQDFMESIKGLLPAGKEAEASNINHALFRDNFKLREDKRGLRRELNTLKETADKVGHVLKDEEMEEFSAFRAFGLAPDQISQVLQEYDTMSATATARDAAEVVGWKPSVLKDLIESKGLVIEMKEVEVGGQKVQMPHVATEDAKGKEVLTPLAEYEGLKEYHPSLVADQGTGGRTHQGVRMVQQVGTGGVPTGKGASEAVMNQLNARYRRPSDKDKK